MPMHALERGHDKEHTAHFPDCRKDAYSAKFPKTFSKEFPDCVSPKPKTPVLKPSTTPQPRTPKPPPQTPYAKTPEPSGPCESAKFAQTTGSFEVDRACLVAVGPGFDIGFKV